VTGPDVQAWSEYRRGLDRLDRVRQEAAAAGQAASIESQRAELVVLRDRLGQLQQRAVAVLGRARLPVPPLAPDHSDTANASMALRPVGSPAAVDAAIRDTGASLDAADLALSTVEGAGRQGVDELPPSLRNLIVYGPAAFGGVLLPLLGYALTPGNIWTVLAFLGLLVLPPIGFAVAYLTVALVFRDGRRTPVVGAAVTVMFMAVGAALMVLGL
jgi:hypothetical protein